MFLIKYRAVFQVENNELDLGVTSYGCDSFASAAFCSVFIDVQFDEWITKAPGEAPLSLSLLNIFTPLVWSLIFFSIVLFCSFLWIAAKVGNCYGIITESYYDSLVPFR